MARIRNTVKRILRRPTLSVVVPCWNAEKTIEKAIRSALNQSLRTIEVIVIDAGSTDRSGQIIQRLADRDSRVRLISLPNKTGPGRARNLGVSKARGKYLTFLDADDRVLPGAYEAAVASLRKTGSDYVIGGYRRHDSLGHHRPRIVKRVHKTTRLNTSVTEFPDLLDEPVLWNKVFTRKFWLGKVGRIPEDRNYEDQEPCLIAALQATSIDVLDQDFYSWRLPEDRMTRSQSKRTLEDLRDRAEVVRNLLSISADAPTVVRRHILSTILGRDLVMYLLQVPYTDEEYWRTLKQICASLSSQADENIWLSIPVQDRVLAYVGAHGSREDVESAVGGREEYTTSVKWFRDGENFYTSLPYSEELATDIPQHLLRLSNRDLSIRAKVWSLQWKDEEEIPVTGYAYVPGIDTQVISVNWELQVLDENQQIISSQPITCWHSDDWVDIDANDPWLSYADSGFSEVLIVPPAATSLAIAATIEGLSGGTITAPLPYPAAAREAIDSPTNTRQVLCGEDGEIQFKRITSSARKGNDLAPPAVPRVHLCHVQLSGATLYLRGRVSQSHEEELRIALVSSHEVFPLAVTFEERSSDKWLWWDSSIDLSDRRLPSAGFFLRFSSGDATTWTDVRPKKDAKSDVPQRLDGPVRSVTLATHRNRAVGITIGPPIPQEFRSRYARQRLQESPPPPLFDAIVFETFSGKGTGDNPGALYETFQELSVGFPCYWSIIDGTVQVPGNAIGIVIGTPEWFRVIRSAKLLITNNNLPIYFTKSPGQYWLQTWHGTPIKRLLFDAPRDSIPLLYRRLMKRQVPWWDLLLAQSDEAARNLCTAMRYEGPVMITEQPRNKRLFQPHLREETRERLGISPDEYVILYAPTWRERYKVPTGTTPDYLIDVEQLSKDRNCTVLVRMHHMNRAVISSHPKVIDVSDEPYIEDLMCASDELISDYSSVIIDYQLLSKKITISTPDRESYVRHERGFYL